MSHTAIVRPSSADRTAFSFLVALYVLVLSAAGCSFDPYGDLNCADGARDGDRTCVDGFWVVGDAGPQPADVGVGDTGVDAGPSDAELPDSGDAGDPADAGDTGVDACVPETDEDLCEAAASNCGVITVTDRCGTSRSPDCGTCAGPETCGGAGTPNQCGCDGSDDAALCDDAGATCGQIEVFDPACDVMRQVQCGTCNTPETCGGGGTPNQCGCVESDADFCSRLQATCGTVVADDACGIQRSVDCGSCTGLESCGTGGTPNQCGCDPGSVCTQRGAECGMVDFSQACSNVGTVDCGGCGSNGSCMANMCDCSTGYAYDATAGSCQDIDECAAGTDTCDTNASCMNTDGSFTCMCNAGFTGDGTSCTPVSTAPTVDEVVSTAAASSSTLTTPSLTAQQGALYVAFIALNTNSRSVTGVSAFGQNFTQRLSQCAGNDTGSLDIWTLRSTGGSNGPVTVQLDNAPFGAAVVVYKIDGAATMVDPVVRTVGANTAAGNVCSGGLARATFMGNTTPVGSDNLQLLGWSRPGTSVVMNPAWTFEDAASSSGGMSGRNADMSVFSNLSTTGGVPIPVLATFGSATQWIAGLVEIQAP